MSLERGIHIVQEAAIMVIITFPDEDAAEGYWQHGDQLFRDNVGLMVLLDENIGGHAKYLARVICYNGVKEVAMIELTEQQRQELKRTPGNEARFADRETGKEYVILPAEVFERWKRLLYDDGDWTPEEQLRLLAESGQRAGWGDPAMDVYDNYDQNCKIRCQ